jgi:hypothetical protein
VIPYLRDTHSKDRNTDALHHRYGRLVGQSKPIENISKIIDNPQRDVNDCFGASGVVSASSADQLFYSSADYKKLTAEDTEER